jgi:hypothetical protein
VAVLCVALGVTAAAAQTQQAVARFNGSGPGSTESFRVEGPWLLNWRVTNEFPTLTHLEAHLYDAETGRLVGIAVRHTGIGSGQRLVREGGEYRIVVVGTGIDWSLEVEQAPGSLADLVKRNPDLTEVELMTPSIGLSRDVVRHLSGWHTQDARTLIVETDDGRTMSIDFYEGAACPGLADAQNIFFVTSSLQGAIFNAIVLENGTRCYFGGAVRVD